MHFFIADGGRGKSPDSEPNSPQFFMRSSLFHWGGGSKFYLKKPQKFGKKCLLLVQTLCIRDSVRLETNRALQVLQCKSIHRVRFETENTFMQSSGTCVLVLVLNEILHDLEMNKLPTSNELVFILVNVFCFL